MSTVEEECESVISTTNEEMLNCVWGYAYKKGTETEIKNTEFAFNLRDGSEDDDKFSKMPCKQNAYISHQAIEDMCGVKTDQLDPNSVTVDSGDPLVVLQSMPNNNSSQNLLKSSVKLDVSIISPSANNTCKLEVSHTNQQPLLCLINIDSAEETKHGGCVDHHTPSDIGYLPPSHSTNNGTSTTAVDGNYITTPDNNQCFSHCTYTNTSGAVEEGSYVDCYIALNNDANPTNAKVGNGELPCSQSVKNANEGSYALVDHVLAVQHGGESDDARSVEPE